MATVVFTLSPTSLALAVPIDKNVKGFVDGIVITVDGEDYHLDGAGRATDIPGHYCEVASPFGAPRWWSSDAPDGELPYKVHVIIDTWSEEKAEWYASRGYVHYREPVRVSDGSLSMKAVWLKHAARTSFILNGEPHPRFAHYVTPGIDYELLPNGKTPIHNEKQQAQLNLCNQTKIPYFLECREREV